MTHAIKSYTDLLHLEITRTHTQMRKSPRGVKESGKEMRRGRESNKIGRNTREFKKERKKERKKKEINNNYEKN